MVTSEYGHQMLWLGALSRWLPLLRGGRSTSPARWAGDHRRLDGYMRSSRPLPMWRSVQSPPTCRRVVTLNIGQDGTRSRPVRTTCRSAGVRHDRLRSATAALPMLLHLRLRLPALSVQARPRGRLDNCLGGHTETEYGLAWRSPGAFARTAGAVGNRLRHRFSDAAIRPARGPGVQRTDPDPFQLARSSADCQPRDEAGVSDGVAGEVS